MIVDLPEPVAPIIARVSPLFTLNEILLIVGKESLLYEKETFLNSISPFVFSKFFA